MLTPKQQALADKHGTPEEFRDACWKAYADLFITLEEMQTGVDSYNKEWKLAGEE